MAATVPPKPRTLAAAGAGVGRGQRGMHSGMRTTTERQSLWLAESGPVYPALSGEATADVAVIGAGITGLTTALLLKRGGDVGHDVGVACAADVEHAAVPRSCVRTVPPSTALSGRATRTLIDRSGTRSTWQYAGS